MKLVGIFFAQHLIRKNRESRSDTKVTNFTISGVTQNGMQSLHQIKPCPMFFFASSFYSVSVDCYVALVFLPTLFLHFASRVFISAFCSFFYIVVFLNNITPLELIRNVFSFQLAGCRILKLREKKISIRSRRRGVVGQRRRK
jgi:hypothetical protein